MIIIMRFSEYVYVQNISTYMNFGGYGGRTYMVKRTFFVYYSKKLKRTRACHILKSNSTSF